MIDTTDPKALELALTYCQGKSIINSINLEDGEEKFERVCPWPSATAPRWWSAASTKTRSRRRRSRASASWRSPSGPINCSPNDTAFAPEDIIFDPLVFPCATGDENYIGGAVETIEGHPPDQGAPALREDGARASRTFRSACRPRPAKWSIRSFCTTAPRPGWTWPSSTRRSSSGSRRFPEQSGAWRRTCCSTRRRSRPRISHFGRRPRTGASRRREQKIAINQFHIAAIAEHFRKAGGRVRQRPRGSAARRAAGQLHHRRHQGRSDRRPGPQARRRAPRRSRSSTAR